MPALSMFIPITKVDAPQRLVYGIVTAETEDRAGEVCDYATTKPFYEKWSNEIYQSTNGKSFGNLRAMHGPVAAGKVVQLNFNDSDKQIEICAKIIDDAEWRKVEEGLYTGFSQGGAYVTRWTDSAGLTRYTASPTEISLVDLPCLAEARFEVIKSDGSSEWRNFRQCSDPSDRLSWLIKELYWLQSINALENSPQPTETFAKSEFQGIVRQLTNVLQSINLQLPAASSTLKSAKTTSTSPENSDQSDGSLQTTLTRRNSVADADYIQDLHDTSVKLGAECGHKKISNGGLDKRFDNFSNTLADILQRIKKIEDQPMPLPIFGPARPVSKAEDAGQLDVDDTAERFLSNPEALSMLAIKLAQRNGHGPIR